MTVYLGENGFVELKRSSGEPIRATVEIEDVSTQKRRFSFEADVRGELMSGDQVDITHQIAGTDLDFIANHPEHDWRGYVFVDIMGGIRLFDTFEKAIRGELAEAIELKKPSSAQPITIRTRGSRYLEVAEIRSYEFTTERENIDLTSLGDQFRNRYEAGLISGQGRLDCFWDHQKRICERDNSPENGQELPIYLAQLCIRLVQGADFSGRFFIYAPELDDPRASRNAVWYEAECIITNVSVNVAADSIIETSIDFITTGTFRLLVGVPPSYLLTEEPAKLLQEDGSGLILSGAD